MKQMEKEQKLKNEQHQKEMKQMEKDNSNEKVIRIGMTYAVDNKGRYINPPQIKLHRHGRVVR